MTARIEFGPTSDDVCEIVFLNAGISNPYIIGLFDTGWFCIEVTWT